MVMEQVKVEVEMKVEMKEVEMKVEVEMKEVEMKVEVEMKEECENDKLLMIGEQIEEYVKPLSKNICQSKYLQIFT